LPVLALRIAGRDDGAQVSFLIGIALFALVVWRSMATGAPRAPAIRRSNATLVSSDALLRVLKARKR
jgi:hypothetical protein